MTTTTTHRLDFIFRITFLFVYVTTLLVPAQAAFAAPVAPAQAEAGNELPEIFTPAPGGYTIASQEQFKPGSRKNGEAASAAPPNSSGLPDFDAIKNYLKGLLAPAYATSAPASSYGYYNGADNPNAWNGLTIEPITAYNVIVDSNVLAPSSYGPNSATIGAKFCNTSGSTLNNVTAYIGDYNNTGGGTPGVYPVLDDTTYPNYDSSQTFDAAFPHLANAPTAVDFGDPARFYALEHEAGSVTDQNDATRFIGNLAAGECVTQYWLVSYPRKALINGSWVDVTGGVKPNDDLWLPYEFWATTSSNSSTAYYKRFLTMRNEISAMANKIWPNTDSKVPDEYLEAISEVLGWDTWVEGGGTTAFPGQTAVSQGIWYDFGVIGAGFDNNYDLVPDRNAWVQPIGDASSYDPGCFRLVRTYGIVIVKLNDGTELLIPFVDQMYFENVPENNTGAVGLVYYEYMALDGACSAGLTPYQEVASGYDNEKFNADFGAGIPPLQSQETIMTFEKTDAPSVTNPNAQVTYTLAYTNVDPDGPGGMSISVGSPTQGAPFVVQDKIPTGTCYVSSPNSATDNTGTNLLVDGAYTPSAYTVFYSSDTDPTDGITWSTSLPTDPNGATPNCNEAVTYVRWTRTDEVANGSTGQVEFKVYVPSDYVTAQSSVTIENTGCIKIGEGPCFAEDTTTTLVAGNSSINGTVWKDDGISSGILGNALQDGGETGIIDNDGDPDDADTTGVTIKLYWDANGDGDYSDTGDFLLAETTTMNYTVVDGRVQFSGSNVTTTEPLAGGINIINGLVDVDGDGDTDANDDGFFGGYPVLNGFINPDNDGVTGEATDDGTLVGVYNFGRLPATSGSVEYIIVVDTADADIPTGYGATTPTSYNNITLASASNYGDATDGTEPSDFGFAPALAINKFITPTTYNEGATLTYTIKVSNILPGSGTSEATCKYMLWGQYAPPDGTPNSGSGTSGWINPSYAFGAPDELKATTDMSNANDYMGISGFNIGPMGGSITKVSFVFNIHEAREMDSTGVPNQQDRLFVQIYYGTPGSQRTVYEYRGDGSVSVTYAGTQGGSTPALVDNDVFAQTYGAEYTVTQELDLQDVVGDTGRTSWYWSDFTNNKMEIRLESNKADGTGDVGADAVGYLIETDGTCGGDSTTLNPVPLTDVFDNRYLTFVSSDPPISSQSTSGNDTTLSWSNVGPLYAGETKLINVTFTAADSVNPTTNTATSANAKFATGLPANSPVTDTQDVVITQLGSISGKIWQNTDSDGWQGTNGYETGEPGIANVNVRLYVCQVGGANFTHPVANADRGKTCAGVGGTWVLASTLTTGNSGEYTFNNLLPGFYYVDVEDGTLGNGTSVTSTLPTGATNNGEKDDSSSDQDGTPQNAGNGTWGLPTNALTNGSGDLALFDYLTSGENITNVNFGYTIASPLIYGTIWRDYNGDGIRSDTTTETGWSGVTVTIYACTTTDPLTCSGTPLQTTTTNSSGYYQFAGLSTTSYYRIVTTPPSGTTNTDEEAPGDDNTNTTVATQGTAGDSVIITSALLASGSQNGGFDFGYHQAGTNSIGDTLFYDWDGDGTQDANDENMPNITVNLYKDLDGDGMYDANEPLAGTAVSFGYKVTDGKLDTNDSGTGGAGDTLGSLSGVTTLAGATASGAKVTDGFIDVNGDNTIDANDTGWYNGIKIINGLLDIDGDNTTGDTGDDIEAGQYRFNYLFADTDGEKYIVRVNTADADFPTNVIETKDPGESGVCSTCDSMNGVTLDTDINSGNNFEQDFGYKPSGTGAIGDYVWKDTDGDGIKDSVETGLSGVTVRLEVDLNGDGTYVTLSTTTTNSSGYYLFSNLPVGTLYNYRVVLELNTANNNIIPDDAYGNQYYNSTGTLVDTTTDYLYINTPITTGSPNNLNGDFGFAPPAAIGDTVYLDINGNATQDNNEPGIPGVTVSLYTFTDSDGDGKYDHTETLGSLISTTYTSYKVIDGKIDVNGDGAADSSDDGTANGCTVVDGLITGGCTTYLGYALLNNGGGSYYVDVDGDGIGNAGNDTGDDLARGEYHFDGLLPNSAGQGYVVVVTPPAGATLTGDPSTDGVPCNGDPACDNKDGMRLYPGTNYTGADFGYQMSGTFGDQLWIDTNDNDRVDTGESPLANITVTATYTVATGTTVTVNGVTYTAGQTVTLTTTTDVNGNYSFYGITITGSNNVTWTVTVDTGDVDFPSGLSNTSDPDGGNNNSTTVTMNPSGAVIQVGSLMDADDDGDSSDALHLDADFGYRFAGNTDISGTVCLETTEDGTCGTSNNDPNGIGAGESAYDNVTVYLYKLVDNPGGATGIYDPGIDDVVLAAVTTTNANGDYAFNDVTNGVYYIIAIGAPQSGLNITSDATDVNAGDDNNNGNPNDDNYTVQYSSTSTASGTTLSAYQVVNATSSTNITDRDFAFTSASTYDFGDLPATYNMTDMDDNPDGARHTITGSLYLGTTPPDSEANGIPSVTATADNVYGTDDEDGVDVDNYPWSNGNDGGKLVITVNGSGYLVAWIDFNNDGDFADRHDSDNDGDFQENNGDWSEFIISQAVSTGTATYTFNLPPGLLSASPITLNMRFRLFTTAPIIPSLSYAGPATGGEVEDYQISVTDGGTPTEVPHTLPVTLTYFHAEKSGSKINFHWITSAETANAGFNLYLETNGELIQLNSEIIPSHKVDSLEAQEYTYALDMAGESFVLEDVNITGDTRRHGPFQLGEEYGIPVEEDKVAHEAIRAEYEEKTAQYHKNIAEQLKKLPAAAQYSPRLQSAEMVQEQIASGNLSVFQLENSLNIKVNKTGIYRITYAMLKNAGLDLSKVPATKVTLMNNGKIVPIFVKASTQSRYSGMFGPGSYFEFYGEALDTLYTDTNIYTVQVSSSAAPRIPTNNRTLPRAGAPKSFTETLTVNQADAYSNTAPGSDPWYAMPLDNTDPSKTAVFGKPTSMLAYNAKPRAYIMPFTITGLADPAAPASIDLLVWGGTDFPAAPDHHLIVSINGVQLADQKFDGFGEQWIRVTIPANTLREGENTLQLNQPADLGSDVWWDLIHLDKFSVKYQRVFRAVDDQLTFTATGKIFTVRNLSSSKIVVYRINAQGAIAQVGGLKVRQTGTTYSVTFAGINKPATYIVSTTGALAAPVIEPTRLKANLNQYSEYLIISHPNFIPDLQPLVEAKQNQGLLTTVVDVNDIYAQYSNGIFTPQAIKDYIAYAHENLGARYVLLVGGDTYDYRNYLKDASGNPLNSISFIPSLYHSTGPIARYVPVDPLYADTNNDLIPDLAIGRFPVRTTAELEIMINKTIAYTAKDYARTAIFVSDKSDALVNFKMISDEMSAAIPNDWTVQSAHLDTMTVANARTQLINAMNNGAALVNFIGHSSMKQWTYNGLFNTNDASSLTNAGKPFVAVQWGCWNTYYTDPLNNTLAQSFLLSGDKGAAGVFGAVTLTESYSEKKLGDLLLPRLTVPGKTMGEAMLEAKIELAKTDPDLLDVILGWTYMGDPALVMTP